MNLVTYRRNFETKLSKIATKKHDERKINVKKRGKAESIDTMNKKNMSKKIGSTVLFNKLKQDDFAPQSKICIQSYCPVRLPNTLMQQMKPSKIKIVGFT